LRTQYRAPSHSRGKCSYQPGVHYLVRLVTRPYIPPVLYASSTSRSPALGSFGYTAIPSCLNTESSKLIYIDFSSDQFLDMKYQYGKSKTYATLSYPLSIKQNICHLILDSCVLDSALYNDSINFRWPVIPSEASQMFTDTPIMTTTELSSEPESFPMFNLVPDDIQWRLRKRAL